MLRVGTGLMLTGLWVVGVARFFDLFGSPVGLGLAVAPLPLIALLLGAWHGMTGTLLRIREALAVSTPLGLFWVLNYPALGAWWIRDDPCHLTLILEHGIWRPFVSSIGFFLTPLLGFSLGLDFSLFGLEPTAFYTHQLLAFSVLIMAGYGFLRAYLTPATASLAVSLFVVSVPAIAVARLLMNRHYLEGLILALGSLTLYRRSVDLDRYPLAIFGAALYLLATTAKEVFVPLVILLPFMAVGDRQRRWRHGLPFVLAAGAYGLWRLSLLGWSNSLSGYGALGGEFHFGALLDIPRLLGLTQPWHLGIAIASAIAVIDLCRRSRPIRLAVGVGALALAAPLVPVAARLEPRHLFVVAFAGAGLLAATLKTPKSRLDRFAPLRALAGTLLLVLALASLTSSTFWRHLEPTLAHHRSEGSFILDESQQGLLLTTVNHSTFLQCLARLRREVLVESDGPGFCGDACYCSQQFPDQQRWSYAESRLSAVEDPACNDCSVDQPLKVDMSHDLGAKRMSWTFGPYADGVYEVLLLSGGKAAGVETAGVGTAGGEAPGISIPVALPKRGSMPYWLFEPLRFVVKYRSPEGWQTYSPVYLVEPDGQAAAEP